MVFPSPSFRGTLSTIISMEDVGWALEPDNHVSPEKKLKQDEAGLEAMTTPVEDRRHTRASVGQPDPNITIYEREPYAYRLARDERSMPIIISYTRKAGANKNERRMRPLQYMSIVIKLPLSSRIT
jgi:hypothetical protein